MSGRNGAVRRVERRSARGVAVVVMLRSSGVAVTTTTSRRSKGRTHDAARRSKGRPTVGRCGTRDLNDRRQRSVRCRWAARARASSSQARSCVQYSHAVRGSMRATVATATAPARTAFTPRMRLFFLFFCGTISLRYAAVSFRPAPSAYVVPFSAPSSRRRPRAHVPLTRQQRIFGR